jgi:hypothetical protein
MRNFLVDTGFCRQQGRDEYRQCGILCAAHRHLSSQRFAALQNNCIHNFLNELGTGTCSRNDNAIPTAIILMHLSIQIGRTISEQRQHQ